MIYILLAFSLSITHYAHTAQPKTDAHQQTRKTSLEKLKPAPIALPPTDTRIEDDNSEITWSNRCKHQIANIIDDCCDIVETDPRPIICIGLLCISYYILQTYA